ncbi:aldose 1-epimerase family protein [Neisseria leonii]|uniref:Aldose 1-epimerase family protein n=1 Tax=Neisseria leonii TaxID=2995413 RepID=A0A9X4IED4_9NEIS|nr:aldose 1-epimerase family protein [Neisseria sp. 51.81]MDD9328107.1 aldose 1-epimerase family protein [Neisseria sp. 51.81]
MYRIPLDKCLFGETPKTVVQSDDFSVTAFAYPQQTAALKIANSRGFVEILPFMGQIIWHAEFDGINLRMDNPFRRPQRAAEIIDTYGCFAFHSGLLSGGCPSPEDTHPLHGEFPCAPMDRAWLEIDSGRIRLVSEYEYVKGFGHHYLATPSVTLSADSPRFDIGMRVQNLSGAQAMPLLYMCHMNYAYVEHGRMSQNLPDTAFTLRRTVPAHVRPTAQWQAFNQAVLNGEVDGSILNRPDCYDPEIVYFADNLPQYGEEAVFELYNPATQKTFITRFQTAEFPHATRWILNNPDQKVAAFALPATARPEGYLAAEQAGTLQWLAPGACRSFTVHTGIKE